MSDSVREACYSLSKWRKHPSDTAFRDGVDVGYQAATAAADAEWRGVVEKLVATVKAYEAKTVGGWIVGNSKQPHELANDAFAQAAELLGRK